MNIFNIIFSNFLSVIPILISAFFTILTVLPIFPYGISKIIPLFGIITVIFWIVHKPDLMTWSSVILIGLLHDLLTGLPLGLGCISLFIVRYIIIKIMYKFDSTDNIFVFLYISFGIFIWLILVIIGRTILNLGFFNYLDCVFQYLLSLAVSPIIIFVNKYFLKLTNK